MFSFYFYDFFFFKVGKVMNNCVIGIIMDKDYVGVKFVVNGFVIVYQWISFYEMVDYFIVMYWFVYELLFVYYFYCNYY